MATDFQPALPGALGAICFNSSRRRCWIVSIMPPAISAFCRGKRDIVPKAGSFYGPNVCLLTVANDGSSQIVFRRNTQCEAPPFFRIST